MTAAGDRSVRPICALCTIADIQPGLGLVSKKARSSSATEHPVIAVRDVQDGRVAPEEELSPAWIPSGKSVERYRVQPGDIVLAVRGSQPKVGLVTEATAGAVVGPNLVRIRSDGQLSPEALAAFLDSPTGRDQMMQLSSSSVMGFALNKSAVEDLRIPLLDDATQALLKRLLDAQQRHAIAALAAVESRRTITHEVVDSLVRGALRPRVQP